MRIKERITKELGKYERKADFYDQAILMSSAAKPRNISFFARVVWSVTIWLLSL